MQGKGNHAGIGILPEKSPSQPAVPLIPENPRRPQIYKDDIKTEDLENKENRAYNAVRDCQHWPQEEYLLKVDILAFGEIFEYRISLIGVLKRNVSLKTWRFWMIER